jgi:hypothetical protein
MKDSDSRIAGVVREFKEPPTNSTPPNSQVYFTTSSVPKKFLVVEVGEGETYIDQAQIAHVVVEKTTNVVTRLQPVLVLQVPKGKDADKPVRIRYLAMGIESRSVSEIRDTSRSNKESLSKARRRSKT